MKPNSKVESRRSSSTEVRAVDVEGIEAASDAFAEVVAAYNAERMLNAELLQALRRLMEYADCGTPVHPGSPDWELARAVIVKAEAH